jgi:hypothetical protein
MSNFTTIMKKILILAVTISCCWPAFGGAESAPSPASQKRDAMVSEMRAAVNEIALKHGNIPFTQIFTNEPQRATAVRQRFMEIERADNLSAQIVELEARLKALQEAVKASEAQAADLERRIVAEKQELASPAQTETAK